MISSLLHTTGSKLTVKSDPDFQKKVLQDLDADKVVVPKLLESCSLHKCHIFAALTTVLDGLKLLFMTSTPKQFQETLRDFFSNIVVEAWNLVPSEIKSARTVISFKNAYRKHTEKPWCNPSKQDGDGVLGIGGISHPEPENS
jgi:hypothetical protein